ncbi:MAG: GNAT family N-acetyltransferase [Desulfobacteraceae bacterium]|nr:MAG: GNAT family N-acetyltransferase [Desulfobacteraceae bacterium]
MEFDFFRAEDAPGIARLFLEVYGDGYPIKTYYVPERLIEENASGSIISSVARTADGEVIGHDALVRIDTNELLYENAAGAVLPAFRGKGIFPRLFKHSIVDASKRFGVEGLVGEPVCSHVHLQKMCIQLGFKELGLEVDLMPPTADGMERNRSERISVLIGVFKHRPGVQVVHIPPPYEAQLEYLYSGLDVERAFSFSEKVSPAEGVSRGSMGLFEKALVARMSMEQIGSDFDAFLFRREKEAREKGTVVFQCWLPLSSPFAPAAVNVLRASGYFLGGMLPCRPGGDGLLMQKVDRAPDWRGIALFTEHARRIGEMIRRDWEDVTSLRL